MLCLSFRLQLQPTVCAPYGRGCEGPARKWNGSTVNKGVCGTSHPFPPLLTAIIALRCLRKAFALRILQQSETLKMEIMSLMESSLWETSLNSCLTLDTIDNRYFLFLQLTEWLQTFAGVLRWSPKASILDESVEWHVDYILWCTDI